MKVVWEGRHFKICHESVSIAGKETTFEFVWRLDGTRTIVVNAERKILLTREYRHELQGFDWRLPGGKLDFSDEVVQVAAARELREETGIVAKNWRYLWSTAPDATVRFKRHFLLATDITVGSQQLSDGENISVHWFGAEKIRAMALGGEIKEEISALSLLRYMTLGD